MIDFGPDKDFINNYQQLRSSRKMAALYHCSKGAILSHAKKIGYDISQNKELKITNIPIEDVIEDYEKLLSCQKVAEKYCCSATAVAAYLKKYNYSIKNHNNKLGNISSEEFIKNYNQLKSAKKVGELYGCSGTAILQYTKKIGYNPEDSKEYKLSQEDKEYIIQSYLTNSSGELAQQFNVTRGMITKVWYDNNLIGKNTIINNTTEIDITDCDFGFWHVLYKTEKRNTGGAIYWHCKCKCGVERDVLGTSLRQGLTLSCGNHSNISKGNYKISQLLLQNQIYFESEKIFLDCKDKAPLPFDFYVDNSYLIEYDGIQHFQESIFDYEYTHSHDIIKTKWCKEHNIPLIRIPYTHFKDIILDDLLLETSRFII